MAWLPPKEAAKHLPKLYPQLDKAGKASLAAQIRNNTLEVRDAYGLTWAQKMGGLNKAKLHEAEKIAARKFADEIWTARTKMHERKDLRWLWRLVALQLDPHLAGDPLKRKAKALSNQHKDWRPPGIVVA